MRLRLGIATVVAWGLALACNAGSFSCTDDSNCSGGQCQPTGYCSFPDDSCDSGQRYGEHAGDLTDACVPYEPTSTATTSPDTSEPSTTTTTTTTIGLDSSSGDPSTSSTTSGSDDSSGSSSTGEPLDPDLLLWFRFDDLAGSQVTVDSAQGELATCRLPQCPDAILARWDVAALFDGEDDALNVAYGPIYALNELTAAAWVRADTLDGSGLRMIFGQPSGGGLLNAWLLYYRLTNGMWEVRYQMNSVEDTVLIAEMTFGLGEWVHLAGVYDGTNMFLYINGEPAGSRVTVPPAYDGVQPITIGHDLNNDAPAGHFDGALDEIRLYARALDPQEIAALAAR